MSTDCEMKILVDDSGFVLFNFAIYTSHVHAPENHALCHVLDPLLSPAYYNE